MLRVRGKCHHGPLLVVESEDVCIYTVQMYAIMCFFLVTLEEKVTEEYSVKSSYLLNLFHF